MNNFEQIHQHLIAADYRLLLEEPGLACVELTLRQGKRHQAIFLTELQDDDGRRFLRVSTSIAPITGLDARKAYIPCLFYLCMPTVTLITLHLDQSLYPLLFTATLALFLHGLQTRNTRFLFFAGIATSLTLFVSFSLIVLIPFLLIILAIEAIPNPPQTRPLFSPEYRQQLIVCFKHLASYLAGILLMQGLFITLFDYHILENYRWAMSAHQNFKIQNWSPGTILYIGWLDLFEFTLWTGIAVIAVAFSYMVKAYCRLPQGWDRCSQMAIAFVPMIICMAFMGKTVAETARLWLFLAPLIALFAGKQLTNDFQTNPWPSTAILVGLQTLTTLAIKLWRDFG